VELAEVEKTSCSTCVAEVKPVAVVSPVCTKAVYPCVASGVVDTGYSAVVDVVWPVVNSVETGVDAVWPVVNSVEDSFPAFPYSELLVVLVISGGAEVKSEEFD